MKKIINSKLYDTETAECLHTDSYGYASDFEHWSESLYVTKKGAFFIAGEGGPLSKYAVQSSSNNYSGGSSIRPISRQEAIAWLESHDGETVLLDRFQDDIKEA